MHVVLYCSHQLSQWPINMSQFSLFTCWYYIFLNGIDIWPHLQGYCRHLKINCVSLDYGFAQAVMGLLFNSVILHGYLLATLQNQSVIRYLTSVWCEVEPKVNRYVWYIEWCLNFYCIEVLHCTTNFRAKIVAILYIWGILWGILTIWLVSLHYVTM